MSRTRSSRQVRGSTDSLVTVAAPVTGGDGATTTVDFTLDHAANGYCISRVERAS